MKNDPSRIIAWCLVIVTACVLSVIALRGNQATAEYKVDQDREQDWRIKQDHQAATWKLEADIADRKRQQQLDDARLRREKSERDLAEAQRGLIGR